jgi:hypothetical protein
MSRYILHPGLNKDKQFVSATALLRRGQVPKESERLIMAPGDAPVKAKADDIHVYPDSVPSPLTAAQRKKKERQRNEEMGLVFWRVGMWLTKEKRDQYEKMLHEYILKDLEKDAKS